MYGGIGQKGRRATLKEKNCSQSNFPQIGHRGLNHADFGKVYRLLYMYMYTVCILVPNSM